MANRLSDQPYYLKIKLDNGEHYIEKHHYDFVASEASFFSPEISYSARALAVGAAEDIRRYGYRCKNNHIYADEVHYPVHRIKEVHVCKDLPDG